MPKDSIDDLRSRVGGHYSFPEHVLQQNIGRGLLVIAEELRLIRISLTKIERVAVAKYDEKHPTGQLGSG